MFLGDVISLDWQYDMDAATWCPLINQFLEKHGRVIIYHMKFTLKKILGI